MSTPSGSPFSFKGRVALVAGRLPGIGKAMAIESDAARRAQSLVVWAFNEGRGAARECDRFLMGATDLP